MNTEEDTVPQAEAAVTDAFPCPGCGADMAFCPDTQSLSCRHCGHRIDIEAQKGDIKEYDFASGESLCSTDWGAANKVIHCESCGAQTVLEAHVTAQRCAFCSSSHVVRQDELPGIRPESLIPFKVSKTGAAQAFAKWLRGRFFAPSDLAGKHSTTTMTGIYIPYWTYDSHTYSAYTAERGSYYWVTVPVTVTRNGKTMVQHQRVRKTRWQRTSGTYREFFDDVLVHASERLDGVLSRRLGSYNLGELVEYRPEYLSGFMAERYSIGLKSGWDRAKQVMRDGIHAGIVRKVNGDEVRDVRFTTSFEGTTYKHILLPLWLSAYQYQGKVYRFLVNGQSGEVHGEAPVCYLKVGACVLGALTVLMVLFMLFGR